MSQISIDYGDVGVGGGNFATVPLINASSSDEEKNKAFSNNSLLTENYFPWKVFDGTNTDTSDAWSTNANPSYSNLYIGYKFDVPTCVKAIMLKNRNTTVDNYITPPTRYRIEACDSGNEADYVPISEEFTNNNYASNVVYGFHIFENDKYYKYWRLRILAGRSSQYCTIGQMQFLGLSK